MGRRIALVIGVIFASVLFAHANSYSDLARQTVSSEPEQAAAASKTLRTLGQKGLDSLFLEFGSEIAAYNATGERGERWLKISEAIDRVAMQKDAFSSRLYWFTDLEKAQLESEKTGKPLISLRLLGNLNEEFSCANSRFFRSILYTDPTISRLLRENFVLHWQSVRPAPRITIDYGDGRKLVRTITGNSIHYLIDSGGAVLDGLPGLYDPNEFADYLKLWSNFYNSRASDIQNRNSFYQLRRQQLISKWKGDMKKLGVTPETIEPKSDPVSVNPPGALRAAPVAVTKMAAELPAVSLLQDDEVLTFAAMSDSLNWKRIGQLRRQFDFSDETMRFIRRQVSGAPELTERNFAQMTAQLKQNIAADTARNEYLLHTRIYKLISENPSWNSSRLNEFIYDRLFLTPSSDVWLGLYFSADYTGLDGNGVIQ